MLCTGTGATNTLMPAKASIKWCPRFAILLAVKVCRPDVIVDVSPCPDANGLLESDKVVTFGKNLRHMPRSDPGITITIPWI